MSKETWERGSGCIATTWHSPKIISVRKARKAAGRGRRKNA